MTSPAAAAQGSTARMDRSHGWTELGDVSGPLAPRGGERARQRGPRRRTSRSQPGRWRWLPLRCSDRRPAGRDNGCAADLSILRAHFSLLRAPLPTPLPASRGEGPKRSPSSVHPWPRPAKMALLTPFLHRGGARFRRRRPRLLRQLHRRRRRRHRLRR